MPKRIRKPREIQKIRTMKTRERVTYVDGNGNVLAQEERTKRVPYVKGCIPGTLERTVVVDDDQKFETYFDVVEVDPPPSDTDCLHCGLDLTTVKTSIDVDGRFSCPKCGTVHTVHVVANEQHRLRVSLGES